MEAGQEDNEAERRGHRRVPIRQPLNLPFCPGVGILLKLFSFVSYVPDFVLVC